MTTPEFLPRTEFALLQRRINGLFDALLRFDNATTARRASISIAKRDAMLAAFHDEAIEMDAILATSDVMKYERCAVCGETLTHVGCDRCAGDEWFETTEREAAARYSAAEIKERQDEDDDQAAFDAEFESTRRVLSASGLFSLDVVEQAAEVGIDLSVAAEPARDDVANAVQILGLSLELVETTPGVLEVRIPHADYVAAIARLVAAMRKLEGK